MKKLKYLLILIFFLSCSNTDKLNEWLETVKKPVICKMYSRCRYTLIDNNGEIYDTGIVLLSLPDTIK